VSRRAGGGSWRPVAGLLLACALFGQALPAAQAEPEGSLPFLVGVGKADITGPPVGAAIWGFGKADQLTEGLHFRLWARAFVIAERESEGRLALVVVDQGSVTHSMLLDVVDRLAQRHGDLYTRDNVLLSATHTHAGPGGYWHVGADSPLGSTFNQEFYDAIVAGIASAVLAAHDSLEPGAIRLAVGEVENAGAQRSAVAYLANPAAERARYPHDTDRQMTQLVLEGASGPVGVVNWFAVHPTAMTFDNRLISGDHKGHASARFEAERGPDFVAAFAQSNCGDVTANLNLDNTGPAGDDDLANTRILAERQLAVARRLLGEGEPLAGEIDHRHGYVDLSSLEIDARFTGDGPQTTCPSAYGYSFGAGSTEDGGGHPLLREGMLEYDPTIDQIAHNLLGVEPPSAALRECHHPKPILIAGGETRPHPSQAQVVPLTLARVGRLALIAVPAEVTTMAGRRLRETVLEELGDAVSQAVIVGYTNDYAGYITTREEYDTQQYEGGHTLYGPWTLAAYRQELTRLAQDLREDRATHPGPEPRDLRDTAVSSTIEAPEDTLVEGTDFGDLLEGPADHYRPGELARAVFVSGNPRNHFRTGGNFLSVERRQGETWGPTTSDDAWSTRSRWLTNPERPSEVRFVAEWAIPLGTPAGSYRLVHHGSFLRSGGAQHFEAASPAFEVK
jgi:neutral ceramidase